MQFFIMFSRLVLIWCLTRKIPAFQPVICYCGSKVEHVTRNDGVVSSILTSSSKIKPVGESPYRLLLSDFLLTFLFGNRGKRFYHVREFIESLSGLCLRAGNHMGVGMCNNRTNR